MRILLVEDNRRFNASLKAGLEEDGYAVDATFDGDEGEAFALAAPYDLIILDVMLPKKDGYSLCRDLRQQRVASPILMLTARDAVDDRVQGLDSGADDYLVKPFSMNELRARLRALLRRNTTDKIAVLQSGDLVLDPANHHVERGGLPIELTPREFAILEYLLRHPNQILTREMIEAHVWDFDFASGSNVVDVYIRRLRRKIDEPHPMKLLETVRGVGYRLLRFTDGESAGALMTDHHLPLTAHFRRVLRSFRFRLTLYFVAILAVILAGYSVFVYTRQSQVLRVEAENLLSTQSSKLANLFLAMPVQTPGEEQDEHAVEVPAVPIDLLPAMQETEVAAVIAPDGSVISQKGNLSASDLSHLLERGRLNTTGFISIPIPSDGESQETHTYLFQITPLRHENQLNGYLIVGKRIDPGGQMSRLAVTLCTGAALILVLAFGGGYWLADRSMKPVHFITHTARQISESDLSQRLRLNREDELGELAGTFDQMLDRVQAAFERQRQFTADASHELRTPLAIIELEANRALERPRSSKEYEQALQIIQSENEWMSRLVNELLLLARLDSGQTDLQAERLDLSEVAVDVVERLNAMAALKKVSLATGELSEAYVQTSRVYLVRLITNLVENAIKYAQGDGARVLVETGSQPRDGRPWGWIRVNDNGPGIPAEHIPHLFNRFYQIDPARSRNPQIAAQAENGSGLGLAIVKSIAEAFGGFVEVKSEAGQGATFTVWLPG